MDDVDTLTMLIDFLLNVLASNDWLMKHCALSFLICFAADAYPSKTLQQIFCRWPERKSRETRGAARMAIHTRRCDGTVAKGRARAVMRAHLGGRIIKLFFCSVNGEANARRRRHFTAVFADARAQGPRPRLHTMLLPVVIPQERNAVHAVRKRPDDLP